MTLMAAIAGTSRLSSCWLPLRMMPPPAKNSSGSRKLKKAALGLRQNMRRSRRYCLQARVSVSAIGGQLQVELLERRPAHGEVLEALAGRERLAGQLVQQTRGVFGLALDQRSRGAAVGDAVVGRPSAQLPRGPDRENAPILDDRDPVGELLRLVEVVGGQQDRLAEIAQLAHRLPCAAARLRIEAGRGLVEEHQLGVPDECEREVQPPQLAARELAAANVGLGAEAGELQHVIDIARVRVEARPVAQGLARGDVAVKAARLQHDADPLAQRAA